MAYAQYFQIESQTLSSSCQIDPTPPTFAGITSATANTDGTILVTWNPATSPNKNPIEYLIYCAIGNNVSAMILFNGDDHLCDLAVAEDTQHRVVNLSPNDGNAYLLKDQYYTLGVRAKDSQGYSDSNIVKISVLAIASGNLPYILQTIATDLANTETLLAADEVSIAASATSLDASATSLATSATDIATSVTDLNNLESELAADIAALEQVSASLAAGAGLGMHLEQTELYMTVTIDEVIP